MNRQTVIVLSTSLALVAGVLSAREAVRRRDAELAERFAALAAAVERARGAPAPERVVEHHVTRELVREAPAAAGPAGRPAEPPAGDAPARRHPAELRFERDGAPPPAEALARRRALERALTLSSAGLDVELSDVDCRATSCRLELGYDKGDTFNTFFERSFVITEAGRPSVEHDGVAVASNEVEGDRQRAVLYVATGQAPAPGGSP